MMVNVVFRSILRRRPEYFRNMSTAQNEKIFSGIYHNYAARVYRHIYFKVGNRQVAEDLMQETFLKTWKYVIGGGRKIENPKDFLYMVANNLIVDHYRSKYKSAIPLESAYNEPALIAGPHQAERAEAIIRMKAVSKHLVGLKETHREIIRYRYLQDLSIREISRLTKKSPNHVSVIIHRGLMNIRKSMGLL
jgi:RNA polymerase sigma-70 factor, ECF subfamily